MLPHVRHAELGVVSDVDRSEAEDGSQPRGGRFRRGVFRQLYPLLSELWQLLDAAAVGVALYAVTRIRGGSFGEPHILLIAVTTALILLVYSWSELFYRLRTRSMLQEAARLLKAWTIVLVSLMAIAYLAQLHRYFPPKFVLLWGAAGFVAQLVLHVAVRKTMHFLRAPNGLYQQVSSKK